MIDLSVLVQPCLLLHVGLYWKLISVVSTSCRNDDWKGYRHCSDAYVPGNAVRPAAAAAAAADRVVHPYCPLLHCTIDACAADTVLLLLMKLN